MSLSYALSRREHPFQMPQTVFFYGPLKDQRTTVGGGETGNERTLAVLTKLGFSIRRMPKILRRPGLGGLARYAVGNVSILFRCISGLAREKDSSLHVASFYGNSLYLEVLYILAARILGRQVILEFRAGGVAEFYAHSGPLYRALFRYAVKASHSVLVQGVRYLGFVKTLSRNTRIYHYPNFLLGSEIENTAERRSCAPPMRLIYFGRISASKNIDFVLSICAELGTDFQCDIVGAGPPNYIAHLRERAEVPALRGKIRILPPADRSELQELLREQHFFVFPTREPREGHSNALNEAMAAGVVPLVSNYGFNEEVLGIPSLVMHNWSPVTYATCIRNIWESGQWPQISEEVSQKVRREYSEQAASAILATAYSWGN
ncbi:MAG: hypothetical protein K0S57_1889 [Ramlibacter sp.]|jgi:glycosyltransferase involved in cell wall biosynthesis|nr:hypothetical protein [Ramlibacter sp.]